MSDIHSENKRLATLVAIDVAGYSRRVENDETGALADVQALDQQIHAVAARHGGRVFNTAGDGFMLEFPTVTGALEAADAARNQASLPLRIGVHIGEVSVTGREDLLGHGVNVAARLQARAPLNGILVSADVVRAVRGDLARRFAPAGRIKLDKMRETLTVYTFGAAGSASPRRIAPRRGLLIGLVVVVVAIAGGAVWTLKGALGPAKPAASRAATGPVRIAVAPLDILGSADPDLQKLAGGLRAEIVRQLTKDRIDVVSADPAPGAAQPAAYAFGGTVERQGQDYLVRLQLNDIRQHVTVWSEQYRDGVARADDLQDAIATEAANVAVVPAYRAAMAKGDTEAMTSMIKANLYALSNRDEDRQINWENQKLLVAKFPNDASIRANFAIVSAFLAAQSTPEQAAELKSLAASEAKAAQTLDPVSDLAHLSQALAFPLVGHWREREAAMLAGLKLKPQSAVLTNHESNFLREVGRLNEAVIWGRLAAAPQPPSANRNATLLLALGAAGQSEEASSQATDDARAWPAHPAVWNARLEALIFQERWNEALALFRPGTFRPVTFTQDETRAWNLALQAMASGRLAAKHEAAQALALIPIGPSSLSMQPHEIYSPGDRIAMLSILGADDEAFTQAAAYLRKDGYADSSFLFWPNLERFRRDKRFGPLVTAIGLTDYWRAVGKWPDVCARPLPPEFCAAQGAPH